MSSRGKYAVREDGSVKYCFPHHHSIPNLFESQEHTEWLSRSQSGLLDLSTKDKLVITLCGGGNAVHVLAADLGSDDNNEVRVFAPYSTEAQRFNDAINDQGYIEKQFRGTLVQGKPTRISAQAEDVVPGSDVIILPIPSFAHASTLKAIKPFLKVGAIVAAMPGQGNFGMRAHEILQQEIQEKGIVVVGFNQLPFQCRIISYGRTVEMVGFKEQVKLASIPASKSEEMATLFSDLLGYIKVAPLGHYMNVSLTPANQVIHPCIMYGLFHDTADEDTFDSPPLFYQKCDSFTAERLTQVSDEVQLIANAAQEASGTDMTAVPTLDNMMREMYGVELEDDSSMQSIFATNAGYAGLEAPMVEVKADDGSVKYRPNYHYRYLTEDIPFGMCVLKGVASLLGVRTPILDDTILWCQSKVDKEYLVKSANSEEYVLEGKDVGQTAIPQNVGITTRDQLVDYLKH
eukprot:TRINITY_DN2867_c0_g1_i3.p1 TRINITY_DN2867_c0_g1~~TRINITY_DN2867_c0_g1_i3.p1  ORF type:complete len:460 (-),score=88.88 TRINITY_DN2867_c0_g1_i3:190-1569(-)